MAVGRAPKALRKLTCQLDDPIRFSETFDASPADMIAVVREQGLEGVVAKLRDSPYETPNLEGLPLENLRLLPKGLSENYPTFKYRPRSYLVTRRWVYEKLWEWCEESPLWQSRVLGSFPEQAEDSLISLKWLEAARDPIEVPAHHRVTIGIDHGLTHCG